MRRIYISDYSLQLLAEERKLLFREKEATASALARLGVDSIDLPAVTRPKEDSIIYKTIASRVGRAELCLPVANFDAWNCFETIKDAENPVLQVCLPVSPIQMEYKAGLKEPALLEKIENDVRAAAEICKTEFVAEDATRAEKDFIIKACTAAQNAGAERIVINDDCGEGLTKETAELCADVVSALDVPVYFRPSNRYGLGLANALAAIQAGCDGIKTAAIGDDALRTDEYISFCRLRANDLDIRCNFDASLAHSICGSIAKGTAEDSYFKQVDGEDVEALQDAGGDIFLDSESGISDVKAASVKLGYDLSEEDIGKVYEALKIICDKKDYVEKKEFEAIISSTAMQAPSTYRLDSYSINTGNLTKSMAYICMIKGDEKLSGVSVGNGPIDSAFRAIDMAVGYHYELDAFQIQALTEGKESLGSTIVKLRSDSGKLYSGTGLSSDIVGAGIEAYINALNKIAYEEQ